MRIIIPSAGRSDSIRTHYFLIDYAVCVPEIEADFYKKKIPIKNLITHPNAIKGLVKKRNWILDNCMDNEAVVMLDDDLSKVYNLSEIKTLSKEEIQDMIYKTLCTAEELGAYLFAWSNYHDTGWYNEMRPFEICCGYINGKSFGLRKGSGLRFDERFELKMDYDIALQNLHKHRICFQNNMFAFAQEKTMRQHGGLSAVRNTVKEKEMINLLKKKYGSIIQDKSLEKKSRIRQRHVQMGITIQMPF